MAYDVAIIGSGFTGAALALQLLRSLPPGARIVLVGPPQSLGMGVAYSTTCNDHLLNVRAGRMSMVEGDAGHFVRWVNQNEPHLCPVRDETADRYLPRSAYGRYVRASLLNEIEVAKPRVAIELVEDWAIDLRRDADTSVIVTAAGQRFEATTVALCVGPGRPAFPLPTASVDGAVAERMIAAPFADARVADIAPDAPVLLLGTGLTMVDQVLALDAAGHRGPLTAISRHGLVPTEHLPTRTEPVMPHLPPRDGRLVPILRAVKRAARAVAAECGDWRAVIDGLRPQTQALWQSLDDASRRRFMRHAMSFWAVHRHRMAPEVARRIAAHRASGRLTVRAGRLLTVGPGDNGPVASFRPRGGRTVEPLHAAWIINCAGKAVSPLDEPFLSGLVAEGAIVRDGLGGVVVDPTSAVCGRDGTAQPWLFALGPLARGRFQEITAVPEIRAQCARVAEAIVDQRVAASA